MANGYSTQKPIFLGISFPYKKGDEGIPSTDTNLEIVKQDLALLLNTRKRERVMLPDFGLDLERLVFENTGPLLRAKAFRQIADAIANYEPRVSLTNVSVVDQGNIVTIDIQYAIDNFSDELSINLNREENGI